jgi:hypothetical protein
MRTDAAAMRTAAGVLITATAVVIAGIFTLTAHGNYGYGRDVMRLGDRFAYAVPVALDVLQIVAVAAAFVLAYAPFAVRVYAWAVFATANASSIAANLADAQARHLPWQGWIGAGVLPVLLSLGVHLAVVTWRHRPIVGDEAARPVPGLPATPIIEVSVPNAQTPPPRTPRPNPTKQPPQRGDQRAQIRGLYAAGTGVGDILKRFNGTAPSRRTVENWTADLRETHAQARAATAARTPREDQ